MRGKFVRGWDNGAGFDKDALTRFQWNYPVKFGDTVGSEQLDKLLEHDHTYLRGALNGSNVSGNSFPSPNPTDTLTTLNPDGFENRPRNFALNYVIKY